VIDMVAKKDLKFFIGGSNHVEMFVQTHDIEVEDYKQFGDGKILLTYYGDGLKLIPAGVEIIEKEVIQKVLIDNPEHLKRIEELEAELENCEEIQTRSAEHIADLATKLDTCVEERTKLKAANTKALKEITKLKKAVDALSNAEE